MDYIESLVKEYERSVSAFTITPNATRTRITNSGIPNYVLSLVKNRDKRMGSCADTGHWVRSGIKPVDAMKILEGRIISSHLKDLNQFGEPHRPRRSLRRRHFGCQRHS